MMLSLNLKETYLQGLIMLWFHLGWFKVSGPLRLKPHKLDSQHVHSKPIILALAYS